jgi:hypothetical protein
MHLRDKVQPLDPFRLRTILISMKLGCLITGETLNESYAMQIIYMFRPTTMLLSKDFLCIRFLLLGMKKRTESLTQSWALAHLFEVRYPLPTQFFPMDR